MIRTCTRVCKCVYMCVGVYVSVSAPAVVGWLWSCRLWGSCRTHIEHCVLPLRQAYYDHTCENTHIHTNRNKHTHARTRAHAQTKESTKRNSKRARECMWEENERERARESHYCAIYAHWHSLKLLFHVFRYGHLSSYLICPSLATSSFLSISYLKCS